jgi:predicted  nucleic acid-binding Zn-ribbon protein
MKATKETPYVTRDVLKEEFNEFGIQLFKYLDKRFDEVNKRIDGLDEKYDKLMTTLDAFLKRLDDIETDNTARDAQIARLERWVEQVAKQAGIKLEY